MPAPTRAARRTKLRAVPEPVPFVPWSKLRRPFIRSWEQGEHVAIIGPTGQGKSTLATQLLDDRRKHRQAHIMLFETKPEDPNIRALAKRGWAVINTWPPEYKDRTKGKIVYWPNYGAASTVADRNRPKFMAALDQIINEGRWTIYFDEAVHITETFRMRHILDELWNGARSNKITVVASSQGTTWIPKALTTQQSWIFSFRPRTEDVAKDTAALMGDKERFYDVIRNLKPHEFVVCKANTHEAYRSKLVV